jgi:hypothetical protein
MAKSLKWTTEGRIIAHDAQGVARAVIRKEADGRYAAQRAVEWPGGARDWLDVGTYDTLHDAKTAAARALA